MAVRVNGRLCVEVLHDESTGENYIPNLPHGDFPSDYAILKGEREHVRGGLLSDDVGERKDD